MLGGDCSVVIGTALALKQLGNYAVFYLDGHTDFIDIRVSQTGGATGMCAAIITGYGHKKLSDISNQSPYIEQRNLWCVGNREYDAIYEGEIINSSANYVSLAELRIQGIKAIADSFLHEIEQRKLDGFWLHVDVDVLNDLIMPCVDSRTPDGLSYQEFNKILSKLFASEKLAGLEITILDPELDPKGVYTNEFVHNFITTFNDSRGKKSKDIGRHHE